jgi:hypothetical protein
MRHRFDRHRAVTGAGGAGLLKHLFSIVLALIAVAADAAAMDVTVSAAGPGHRIVVAKGLVVHGDVDRLAAALKVADRDASGRAVVALDSLGGLVDEALELAALMEREKVATVVRAGASCASACAQVMFLGGNPRTVEQGGRLGLHSCSHAADHTAALLCNDVMARVAEARGAPYGTLMAFMQMTPPGEVRWLDAEDADCWGLTLWPPGSGRGIQPGGVPPGILHGPRPKASPDARSGK